MKFNTDLVIYSNYNEYKIQISKDIIAFLNINGGSIFIGSFQEQESLLGNYPIQHSKWKCEIENWLSSDNIIPNPLQSISFYSIKHFLEIRIYSGKNKPYSMITRKKSNFKQIYVRDTYETRLATDHEIKTLIDLSST